MTTTEGYLKKIAVNFAKMESYPNLTTEEIRKVIKYSVGATTQRSFFKFLRLVQSSVKESSNFTFDVSNFCNYHLEEIVN